MNRVFSGKSTRVSTTDQMRESSIVGKCVGAVVGSIFLAVMSQIAFPIPFSPVPVTLQTLGVFLLALKQGRWSVASVALYLSQASVGLPVLAGGMVNPLWLLSPKGGYLLGFLAAAYLIAWVRDRARGEASWLRTGAALILGQLTILGLGTIWMGCFLGFSKAYALGVAPFWMGAGFKIAMALGLSKPIDFLNKLFPTRN